MKSLQGRKRFSRTFGNFLVHGLFLLTTTTVLAQDRETYLTGTNGQLEMVVHILGEVKKPGEYRVVDTTNLMELISKAQGPTEFSKLNSVTITRAYREVYSNGTKGTNGRNGRSRKMRGKRIVKFNVKDYLSTGKISPPTLRPGDVVMIPRNNWQKWRKAFTIVRDLSVVASAYFLYLRSTKN
ncbi:SLBB domain-containing protein [bacterium]|nr:SLBB domain-containing protein [bacterium]